MSKCFCLWESLFVCMSSIICCFFSLHFKIMVHERESPPPQCDSPLLKGVLFSLLWLLCTLTHSACTSSPAHHGSVSALRSWWGDRKDFRLLNVAWFYCIDWSRCMFHLWQKKKPWTQRGLVEFTLSEYQIAHYIYPWRLLSGLSWTQQTNPIWKSTFWISTASALVSIKAKFKMNMRHMCKSSWTCALFSLP